MTLHHDYVQPGLPLSNGHDNKPNGHDRLQPAARPKKRDRGPQRALAKRIAGAKRRRAKALAEGRHLLSRGTTSNDALILERMRLVAEAYGVYRTFGWVILEAELL